MHVIDVYENEVNHLSRVDLSQEVYTLKFHEKWEPS